MPPSGSSGHESTQSVSTERAQADHDTEKWCKSCRYPLRGLQTPGECPECGRSFDLRKPWTYACTEVPARNIFWNWPRVIAMGMAVGIFLVGLSVSRQLWCMAIVIYPFWLASIAFLTTFALTPTAAKIGTNITTGALAGAVIGWVGDPWLALFGVVLGAQAGFMVTYFETLGLRSG